MKKFYAKRENDYFVLTDSELAHFNVLRCTVGERILCLGDGDEDYLCEVSSVSKKEATANIIKPIVNTKNPKKHITVFQGLVKGEKTDLIVQKLTELGISKLVMFESSFAIAKANLNKLDRLNKISLEACKQCGRNKPLDILPFVKFDEMVNILKQYDVVIFANEKNTKRNLLELKNFNNIAIIVGSEGGFSDDEIDKINNIEVINFGLGERILRAETAAISISAIVGYMVEV